MSLVVIIVIAIVAYAIFFKGKAKNSNEPTKVLNPPSEDVVFMGCSMDYCDYASPDLINNENYDSTGLIYCQYQKKAVKLGSKCPYAVEHPDKLSKSVLDDLFG